MKLRFAGAVLFVGLAAACAAEEEAPPVETTTEEMPMDNTTAMATLECAPMLNVMEVDGRVSPYDSTAVAIGDGSAKVCYNRPSMRGREIFGGLVPYDTLWRTGANEPTTIHLPFPAEIAGMSVEPGSYSLYTVPGEDDWTVIVNRSISQWGIESAYSPDVRSQEVGRAEVEAEEMDEAVELFTIDTEPMGSNGANLLLEWENTRVKIPIERS